jgi:glutamate formiminotransferase / formiminotetrahydrofolate cyclodeaminase
MKIIECVPNFSEGRNVELFNSIKEVLSKTPEVKLLNLEPDTDYNRVVVTLAGNESSIIEGAVNACKCAAQMIDMTTHKGEHPRLGAIDVVPFVPVKNASMEECVKISEVFGERIAKELNVPVYLYEYAARNPNRVSLSSIRKGEYEGLEAKLQDEDWKPDFGESIFNAKLGAIVTGARFFLIAYNVNIKSTEMKISKEIAETLRESGKPKRDINGNVVKEDGKTVNIPGKLKNVKGMGVSLEKYSMTQVSMNLTNYNITPIHVAFEEVKKEATRLGAEIDGSEIVGLVPLEALLQAGRYYSEGKASSEEELMDLAIEKLGLSNLNPFDKKQKIIDYMI